MSFFVSKIARAACSQLRIQQHSLQFLRFNFSQNFRENYFEELETADEQRNYNSNHNGSGSIYIRQMKQSLLSESDFATKFKKERDIIQNFVSGPSSHQSNNRQNGNQRYRDVNNAKPLNTKYVITMHHLLIIAVMLKQKIDPSSLNINYFYEKDFLQNDRYQSIVRTLTDLSEEDLIQLMNYMINVQFKETSLKISAVQKFDIMINLIQMNLSAQLNQYLKQMILSVEPSQFNLIKPNKIVILMKELTKIISHSEYHDLDAIAEHMSKLIIVSLPNMFAYHLSQIIDPIHTLGTVSPKSCFPFKNLITQIQLRVIEVYQTQKAVPIEMKIITGPKFILNLVKIMKFSQDFNPDCVAYMEECLAKLKPDRQPFKSHLLFFNSLSVIGSGQKILSEMARLLEVDPIYANEANEYELGYIIKLMYNEYLLNAQSQTRTLWGRQHVYQKDIESIKLFEETPLSIKLDSIISRQLNSVEDISNLDLKSQLMVRKIYQLLFKANKRLSDLVETHSSLNQEVYGILRTEENTKINEFNSDVISILQEHKLAFETEKFIAQRQCDIYVPSLNLVIELDGKYHQGGQKLAKDQFRDLSYLKLGYRLLQISISNWELIRVNQQTKEQLSSHLQVFQSNPELIMSCI